MHQTGMPFPWGKSDHAGRRLRPRLTIAVLAITPHSAPAARTELSKWSRFHPDDPTQDYGLDLSFATSKLTLCGSGSRRQEHDLECLRRQRCPAVLRGLKSVFW